MKNTSGRSSKTVPAVIFLLIAGIFHPCAAKTFEIKERRAIYFIIVKDGTLNIAVGSTGNLYAGPVESAGKPAGTFKVVDVHENRCLCIIESLKPGSDDTGVTHASFVGLEKKTPDISILGIPFTRLSRDNAYYISRNPVPVKHMEPASIAAIKEVLFRIEAATNKKFRADLAGQEHIERLGLQRYFKTTGKKEIYLGTKGGKAGMIYEENGLLRHMEISPGTIEKFKENMYFYIILEKRTKKP